MGFTSTKRKNKRVGFLSFKTHIERMLTILNEVITPHKDNLSTINSTAL